MRATKHKAGWGKAVVALALATFLFVAAPVRPANAFVCGNCSQEAGEIIRQVETMAQWAQQFVHFAAEAAQWINDNIIKSSVGQATINAMGMQTRAQGDLTTMNSQMRRQDDAANRAAMTSAENMMPGATIACALRGARTAESQMRRLMTLATDSFVKRMVKSGTGVGVNPASNAYKVADVNDRCKLGFLPVDASGDTEYGAATANIGCTKNDEYAGAGERPEWLLSKDQIPLPEKDHSKIVDGRLFFYINQPIYDNLQTKEYGFGLGSELDFAAAYKFCESLQPQLPAPTTNRGTTTVGDVLSIYDRVHGMSRVSAATSECFRSLMYRMSCPQRSESAFLNTGSTDPSTKSCFAIQRNMCRWLKQPKEKGGLGLTMADNDPVAAAALQKCETEGLSLALYDKIMAESCNDPSIVEATQRNFSAVDAERQTQVQCGESQKRYLDNRESERQRLLTAIQALQSAPMDGGGGGARMVK